MPDLTPADILWILISAALVLLMQAGFLCLETGLTRSKNNINVAMKNVIDFAVSVITFWAVGYGLMFGASLGGFIGSDGFLPDKVDAPGLLAFLLFQSFFCGTATTIVSGAVAERLSFPGYLLTAFLISVFIYPVFGHWAWNGLHRGEFTGWLGQAGFVDWAGSSVVHSCGGWLALAVLLVIGPRLGRFDPNGRPHEFHGANVPMAALGTLLLWFGWIGFNGGSTLALNRDIPLIVANTSFAAAAGCAAAMVLEWRLSGLPKVIAALNGTIAGLVAITASAHAVAPVSAIIIGAVGGMVAVIVERWLIAAHIDDALGAFAVHTGAGVWGTLAVALFGIPERLGTGLTFLEQLGIQTVGVLACALVCFVVPYLVLLGFNRLIALRVSPDAERVGLNLSEHGARTELHDFYDTLRRQSETGDLSLRAPDDPFTEIGQIGLAYNNVMDSLEEAAAKVQAIVETAGDAIVIFTSPDKPLLFHNPRTVSLFGYEPEQLAGLTVVDLVPGLLLSRPLEGQRQEFQGVRADGTHVFLDTAVTPAVSRRSRFFIATFCDISERKRAEAALKASEAQFRSVFAGAALGLALLDRDTRVLDANPALQSILRHPVPLAGTALSSIVHVEDRPTLLGLLDRSIGRNGIEQRGEIRLICHDGKAIWARLTLAPAVMGPERTLSAIAILEDITDRVKTQEALQLAASVFESTHEAIVIFDAEGRVERVNAAFTRTTGYSLRETRFLRLQHLASNRYDDAYFAEIDRKLKDYGHWQGEILARRSTDELLPIWLSLSVVRRSAGGLQNVIGVLTDLTERKEQEEAIWRHASFDAVTGLPNRRLLQDRLSQALESARRAGRVIALMFLDLDRFKWVNDSLGHQAGDDLLTEVARRLTSGVRVSDTVARFGGDEFVVLVQNMDQPEQLSRLATSIIEIVSQPVRLRGVEVSISTSIGIALFPKDADNSEDLVRRADTALYHAKELGRNNCQMFSPELNERLERRILFERAFQRAMDEEELFVLYQPQLDIATGRLTGVEALVRWRQADGAVVRPDDFIPLAEETSLVIRLGDYVLAHVLRDIKMWDGAGMTPLPVSVNVSARQLEQHASLVNRINTALEGAGVAPGRILVEITESSIMVNEEHSPQLLLGLREMGISVALDDFGRGYSSLSRLKNLPIDVLKLDREFLRGVPHDPEDRALATAIVEMAKALGIEVVAEGIEREEQLEFLRQIGCDKVQGYLISYPISAVDLIVFARERAEIWSSCRPMMPMAAEEGVG